MDLLGKTLGQYQLIEVIHQGENTVYKGFQPAANRYVAVKVLPPARASDRIFVQQFRQDMELIGRLKHPNILPLLTYGRQEGLLFLVTPYIASGTLHDHLPQYYTPAQAQQIVTPVASALDYIHSQGTIDGNLKPSNVLLSPQRQPLLADLGFSQGLDLAGRDEAYLSPEQLQDGLVDRSTDIYALGALLYRMVVGETPPVGGGGSPGTGRSPTCRASRGRASCCSPGGPAGQQPQLAAFDIRCSGRMPAGFSMCRCLGLCRSGQPGQRRVAATAAHLHRRLDGDPRPAAR